MRQGMEDEAEVTLLPSKGEYNHQKSTSCSWQFWKCIIVFLIFIIIAVWIVFTMSPSVVADTKKLDNTQSESRYTEKCQVSFQNTNHGTEWTGFVHIVPGTLIYSAYYDDTNKTFPFVRIIGISKTFNPPRLFCHLRCGDKTEIEEAEFRIVEDHKNRRHAAFIISCSFPRGLGRDPGSITLSAFYDKKRTKPITIPVQSTKDRRHVYNYTVCVPPIHGTEVTATNFVEFIEMNRILGATNFIIYDEYIHPRLKKVVQIYQDKGVVQLLPWNIPRYLNDFYGIHYHGQQVAIEDCLYRSRGRTKWVGFHDLDEFIVPFNHSSLPSLLNAINTSQSAGYCIRSVLLPRNVELKKKKNRNRIDEIFLTQHYFYRSKTIFKKRKRSKCIVDPRKVFEMGIHSISHTIPGYNESWVDPDIALVFHYRQCIRYHDLKLACKELELETFMLRYQTTLRNNVDNILRLVV